MKILQTSLKRFHAYTHGYFAAKPFFQGRLIREIFSTLFDTKNCTASYAYFFLCEKNILLFSHMLDGMQNALVELDAQDELSAQPADSPSLKDILNAVPGVQHALAVRTTGPVQYVLLGGRYILLLNIQPDAISESSTGSLATLYLTGGNYLERTDNALQLMRDILAGRPAGEYSPIHGLGASIARFNIYTVAAVTIFFVPLFFLVPLGLYLTFQAGPVLAWGLALGLFIAWIAWLFLF